MAKVKTKSEIAATDQIATLIKIWKSASVSGDESLRIAAENNLAKYGIHTSDLACPKKSFASGGGRQ